MSYRGYSESNKQATMKYRQKAGIEKLQIDLPQGKKAEYKAKAASKGMSLTAYIVSLIENDH